VPVVPVQAARVQTAPRSARAVAREIPAAVAALAPALAIAVPTRAREGLAALQPARCRVELTATRMVIVILMVVIIPHVRVVSTEITFVHQVVIAITMPTTPTPLPVDVVPAWDLGTGR
jgi:hypothetical protein